MARNSVAIARRYRSVRFTHEQLSGFARAEDARRRQQLSSEQRLKLLSAEATAHQRFDRFARSFGLPPQSSLGFYLQDLTAQDAKSMRQVGLTTGNNHIAVDPSILKLPVEEIASLLVHELIHTASFTRYVQTDRAATYRSGLALERSEWTASGQFQPVGKTREIDEGLTDFLALYAMGPESASSFGPRPYLVQRMFLTKIYENLQEEDRPRFIQALVDAKKTGSTRPVLEFYRSAPVGLSLRSKDLQDFFGFADVMERLTP